MSEQGALICLHAGLMALQLTVATCAIMVDAKFATLAPIISVYQGKLPDPFKKV
jgi:hypothetical protein